MTTFLLRGGGSSLTSGHAELVSASHNKEIPKPVRNDKYVSEAHINNKPHFTHAKRAAFTLAEGATHTPRNDMNTYPLPLGEGGALRRVRVKVAFTLAEVLITLGIIGIVAAMTIPTLAANYQNKTWNTSAQVFERKLDEALKTMNTQQVLAGYSSTAEFVGELSKHFKINKICNSDEINSCFADKIHWGKNDLEVSTENVKTAAGLGQHDWNSEAVGVQFANGTSGIIAYNPDCREQPFTNQFTGTSCIALLYDTSGFKSPNKDGKDLRYINVTEIDGHKPCSFELSDGTCFTIPFNADPLSVDECEQTKDELGIPHCDVQNRLWAGYAKVCGGTNKMPTINQLAALAKDLYGENVDGNGVLYATWNQDIVERLGVNTSLGGFYIFAGEPCDTDNLAYARSYTSFVTGGGCVMRESDVPGASESMYGVCIAD